MCSEDPLAYDRLVRQFQSIKEREDGGKKKGYAGLLEAELWRQQARTDARDVEVDQNGKVGSKWAPGVEGEVEKEEGDFVADGAEAEEEQQEEEKMEAPGSKEEGLEKWRSEMEQRFLEGRDVEFEYEAVDGREEFDDWRMKDREEEERWFEVEEAAWADGGQAEVAVNSEDGGEAGLEGQTGVQDF